MIYFYKNLNFTNTKYMEVAFFIIFGIITFFVLDFRISIVIMYDASENLGYIKIKIFGILIFDGEISLTSEYFKMVHGKKKVIQINLLSINKETIRLFEDISSLFLKRINLVRLKLFSRISGDSPYTIAMLSGVMSSIYGLLLTKLQTEYPYSQLDKLFATSFCGGEFSLAFSGKIFINIYDFIWAIARAIYIRRFGNYGEKRDLYERRKRKLNY